MMKHTAANGIKQTQESPDKRGFQEFDASYCITVIGNQPSKAIVHIVLNWMGAHPKTRHFFHLEADVGINHIVSEYTTAGQELTIGFKGFQNPDEVGAAAVDYLRVAGHLVFAYFFARMASVALKEIAAGNTDPFYQAKLQTARFYFNRLMPETSSLMRRIRAGSEVLMDTDAALA
jgi:hypothetical protein